MTSAVGIEVEEHFSSETQQRESAELGMWIFLLTELLLFAATFLVALALRVLHPQAVGEAARNFKMAIGGVNTAVLVTSGLTMSAAIELSRMGRRKDMIVCLLATAALGAVFVCLTVLEYYFDYTGNMTPFFHSRPYELTGNPATILFVDLYYIITSLSALHVTIGTGVLLVMVQAARAPDFLRRRSNRITITGLFWHFINLIWMVAYPTLYVLDR